VVKVTPVTARLSPSSPETVMSLGPMLDSCTPPSLSYVTTMDVVAPPPDVTGSGGEIVAVTGAPTGGGGVGGSAGTFTSNEAETLAAKLPLASATCPSLSTTL
jgi:hypothetical protein